MKTERIHPSEIRVGDHIVYHGFIHQVTRIVVGCYTQEQIDAQPDYVEINDHTSAIHPTTNEQRFPVYGIYGTYVSGDEKMFNWFRHTISYGERCGERTNECYQQGNELASWSRVTEEEAA